MKTCLVRRPGPRLPEGLVTHIEREPVDLALALKQWDTYVSVLADAGWEIIEVPPIDDCPDATFLEDSAVVFGGLAVACRPGAPTRRDEVAGTIAVLRDLGFAISTLSGDATMDGGDVLKVGMTVYVGESGRTNREGIDQLSGLIAPSGFRVVGVPTTKVLHLKSAVTALPDGTVIGYGPLVDDARRFDTFRGVPEESGAHVVALDDRKLLMAASAPRTADEFRADGYRPIEVDISEYEKLEGCVTCLSIRLRAEPATV